MKTSERGQAMTESMAIIMILMLAVMGLTGIVSLERRIYMENLVASQLNLTFSTFGSLERSAGGWAQASIDAQLESERLANFIVNTPIEPFGDTPGSAQIPLKVSIVSRTLSRGDCRDELSVKSSAYSDETRFAVNGCSKERGWLMPVTAFLNSSSGPFRKTPTPVPMFIPTLANGNRVPHVYPTPEILMTLEDPEANLVTKDLFTTGLFAGQGAFAFRHRAEFPSRSFSLPNSNFEPDYAKSGAPKKNENLNRDCFFNPYLRFTSCEPSPMFGALYDILGDVSQRWMALHFSKCSAELLRSSLTIYDYGVKKGLAMLAWRSGNRALGCSNAQDQIEKQAKLAKLQIEARTAEVNFNEERLLMELKLVRAGEMVHTVDRNLTSILRE